MSATALALLLSLLLLACLLLLMSLLRDDGDRRRKQQAERNGQWRCECFHDGASAREYCSHDSTRGRRKSCAAVSRLAKWNPADPARQGAGSGTMLALTRSPSGFAPHPAYGLRPAHAVIPLISPGRPVLGIC